MRRILALVVLALAGSVGSAQATTVTFEDLALDSMGIGGDRTSGGFFFDTALNHSHIDNGTGGWNTTDGTKFMMVDNVAANPLGINNSITFSPTGGAPFSLNVIDISEAGGGGTPTTGGDANGCCSTCAHQIEVTGNLVGGGTVFRLLTLNYNGTTIPSFGFETFTFNSDWDNLSSVVLEGIGASCCGNNAASRGNYFAIDNIGVDVAATVPEPGTLSLLGLGSAYLIRRRQRNRR